MAVLIRESREIDGKEYKDLRVFHSENPLITKEDEMKALKLDGYISEFFKKLSHDAKMRGLHSLKNKAGVITLWYFVGEGLRFVDNPKIVHPSDKKYIWRALWQHAGDLAPGEMKSRAGTGRDHFFYCYRLALFEKEFVLSAGNWREWQEFFDSAILGDRTVLEWFERKIPEFKTLGIKNWLRGFIKVVNNEFQNIDLSFLSEIEISTKLDRVFKRFTHRAKG